MDQNTSYIRILALVIAIKMLLMSTVIIFFSVGLGPDEAQYWTWSQILDWGYYSKPPGIAWQIKLGTLLFGDTEFGVRFFSLIFSAIQSFLVYQLALTSGLKQRTAFWAATLMALCPIGIFGSLFAITDGGFLLFWTCAAIITSNALRQNHPADPILVGLCLLGGALFKWPIYLFWGFYFLFIKASLSRTLAGVFISLLGLAPSFWWNINHDWATFRHVGSTIQGGHGGSGGNPFEFIGSQVALISPILFVLLILSFFVLIRERKEIKPPLLFCGTVSLSLLGIALIASLFQKIQGNWVLFSYPTALVFLTWYALESPHKKESWIKSGLILNLLLIGLVFAIPELTQRNRLFAKINPFKHNMGWSSLSEGLNTLGYDPAKHFLVSDKYQTTSVLSFYGKDKKRGYFLNLNGIRRNQFSYWPDLKAQEKGKTGFFVWVENEPHYTKNLDEKRRFYQTELLRYFNDVEEVALIPLLKSDGLPTKWALIFRCSDCKNFATDESNLF